MSAAAGKFLSAILEKRVRAVESAQARAPLAQVRREAEHRKERRDFPGALASDGVNIIAELKKASPSRGILRADYQPEAIAIAYQEAGAAALSVLTEESYFHGSLDHLRRTRAATCLPVLRKDFILVEYQIYEAVAAGADAVLLIVAALDAKRLTDLVSLSGHLHITPLVEVHSDQELATALESGARLLGVNNRDLRTFAVSQETSLRLVKQIPRDCIAVSESGIRNGDDVARMKQAGFHAVLVGEPLMRAPEPGRELAAMLAGAQTVLASPPRVIGKTL